MCIKYKQYTPNIYICIEIYERNSNFPIIVASIERMKKILIIRFSSIGDIVLTSPVPRILKQQFPELEIHYISKVAFKNTLLHNPYISKLHLLHSDNQKDIINTLKSENFDFIIDLQRNHKSFQILKQLKKPYKRLKKLNIKKWLYVQFKWNLLPEKHIVDRYIETADALGIINDKKGLDYFLSAQEDEFGQNFQKKMGKYTAIAIGAAHNTKQIPVHKIIEIIHQNPTSTFILLGGKEDKIKGNEIAEKFPQCHNFAGQYSLNESAALIKYSHCVIAGDTGLMHIAAAFQKKIFSLWGNTVPAFGMYPYMPLHSEKNRIIENKEIKCRPCSKLGKKKCPKGHFNCMNQLDVASINTQ